MRLARRQEQYIVHALGYDIDHRFLTLTSPLVCICFFHKRRALAPWRLAKMPPQKRRRIFAELTVWENLDVAARAARREGSWTIEGVYELFPVLRQLRDRRGGFLSGGEQQMLTIARTLMGNPELLLLDEPSEGLAPLVVETLLVNIRALKKQGVTILLAEQGVDFSLALADRVYVLEKGTIRYTGTAAELRDDDKLRNYLLSL
jgi:branched-chain amino acid transport system ATP-binding protein